AGRVFQAPIVVREGGMIHVTEVLREGLKIWIIGAGLDQKDPHPRVFGKAGCDHAAAGASTHDDNVVFVAHRRPIITRRKETLCVPVIPCAMSETYHRRTLSEQRANARSALVPARLFGHCVCDCGHPFVWHCFYSSHLRSDGQLEECFPYCGAPCPGAV